MIGKFSSPSVLFNNILSFKHDVICCEGLGHERPNIVREVPLARSMFGHMKFERDLSLRIVTSYLYRVVWRSATTRIRGHSEEHVAIEVDLWSPTSFRPTERQQ